jgi:hypothetical protein
MCLQIANTNTSGSNPMGMEVVSVGTALLVRANGQSTGAMGVRSIANQGTALKGESTSGAGVVGQSAGTWPSAGVKGTNSAYGGIAITGIASNTTASYGMYGEGAIIGVQGYATAPNSYSVQGHSNSTGGHGIDGSCGNGCADDTTNGYAIFANGRAGGSTNWIPGSDVRLKKDINDLKYGTDQLMKLRPVTFKLRAGDQNTHLGFIAQEVKPIIPELVHGDESKGMLGLDYTALIPVLVKAVQDQQRLIASQQAAIDRLQSSRAGVAFAPRGDGLLFGLSLGLVPLGMLVVVRRRKNSGDGPSKRPPSQ